MASDDVQTNLRLPADLKDRLMASAIEHNRSLSAEAVSRLEASFAASESSAELASTRLRVAELQGQLDGLKMALKSAQEGMTVQQTIIRTVGGLLEVVGQTTPGATEKGTSLIRKLAVMGRAFSENDLGGAWKAYEEFMDGGAELHNQAVTEKWPGYEQETKLIPRRAGSKPKT